MGAVSADAQQVAYRSGADVVLAVYRIKSEEFRAHHERLFAQLRDWGLGDSKGFVSSGSIISRHDSITGVIPINDEDPPPGWRRDKDGAWVPRLTTKLGKQLKVELEAVQPPIHLLEVLPGMERFTMRGNKIFTPAMFVLDEVMYLYWAAAPDYVDFTIWEEIKISDWYLAKETNDERQR